MPDKDDHHVFMSNSTNWYEWFVDSFVLDINNYQETDFSKNYPPLFSSKGNQNQFDKPVLRASHLAFIRKWNSLNDSDQNKHALKQAMLLSLEAFCNWFIFRVSSNEWVYDFLKYTDDFDFWLDCCEKAVPFDLIGVNEFHDRCNFNRYFNQSISQFLSVYLFPLFNKIHAKSLSEEEKIVLNWVNNLLKEECRRKRDSLQTYGTLIFVNLGLELYDNVISYAKVADQTWKTDSKLFITAGASLTSHCRYQDAWGAFDLQDVTAVEDDLYHYCLLIFYSCISGYPQIKKFFISFDIIDSVVCLVLKDHSLMFLLQVCAEKIDSNKFSIIIEHINQNISQEYKLSYLQCNTRSGLSMDNPCMKFICSLLEVITSKIETNSSHFE